MLSKLFPQYAVKRQLAQMQLAPLKSICNTTGNNYGYGASVVLVELNSYLQLLRKTNHALYLLMKLTHY